MRTEMECWNEFLILQNQNCRHGSDICELWTFNGGSEANAKWCMNTGKIFCNFHFSKLKCIMPFKAQWFYLYLKDLLPPVRLFVYLLHKSVQSKRRNLNQSCFRCVLFTRVQRAVSGTGGRSSTKCVCMLYVVKSCCGGGGQVPGEEIKWHKLWSAS